jgi:hypothetical protein
MLFTYLTLATMVGLNGCLGWTFPSSLVHRCSVAGPVPAVVKRKRQTKPVVHCTAGVAEGLRYYRFYFDYSSSRGLVAGNRTTMHANCSFADENPRSIMLRLG